MSISMRLAIPAPAAAAVAPPRLRGASGRERGLSSRKSSRRARRPADGDGRAQGMRLFAPETAAAGRGGGPAKPAPGGSRRVPLVGVPERADDAVDLRGGLRSAMACKRNSHTQIFPCAVFALQAPCSIISWIKGEYGQWTAFLALLVRLFFFIPGELELPLSTMLLVSVAPNQLMNLRGTQGGAVLSLAIAGYLAFQHFTRVGGLGRAFEQGSVIATLAIICITIIPLLLLF